MAQLSGPAPDRLSSPSSAGRSLSIHPAPLLTARAREFFPVPEQIRSSTVAYSAKAAIQMRFELTLRLRTQVRSKSKQDFCDSAVVARISARFVSPRSLG